MFLKWLKKLSHLGQNVRKYRLMNTVGECWYDSETTDQNVSAKNDRNVSMKKKNRLAVFLHLTLLKQCLCFCWYF